MNINELLKQKNITKYRLSKSSGVPQTTIIDICNGKTRIEKCAADTIYKLAKTLDVTMEDLLSSSMEKRPSFEWFKSETCHKLKREGDLDFIINILQSGKIRELYNKKLYPECLYLLAMVDYLSRENDLPLCSEYNDIRRAKLSETVYPVGVLIRSAYSKSEVPLKESVNAAIPEFIRHNIVESEIRNVF
jgi:transcriptional regulator with XRE-family HTH domain